MLTALTSAMLSTVLSAAVTGRPVSVAVTDFHMLHDKRLENMLKNPKAAELKITYLGREFKVFSVQIHGTCYCNAISYGMKPCPRDSNDFENCVLRMASDSMSYIVFKGQWNEFGTLDPAPGINFNLKVHIRELLSLQLMKDKFLWRGLKNTAISNFKFDLVGNIMSFDLNIPSVQVDTPVIAKGNILDTQINADENTSPPVMVHFTSDEFTASFSFNFIQKTNASGMFLLPSLKFYETTDSSGTLKIDNILPVNDSPGERSQRLVKQSEEVGADILVKLVKEILQKMVVAMISYTMQMNTYDQFFPEDELAAARDDAGVAMTLTGSWLAAITVHMTVLLLAI